MIRLDSGSSSWLLKQKKNSQRRGLQDPRAWEGYKGQVLEHLSGSGKV